jgi:hypothetical protein
VADVLAIFKSCADIFNYGVEGLGITSARSTGKYVVSLLNEYQHFPKNQLKASSGVGLKPSSGITVIRYNAKIQV